MKIKFIALLLFSSIYCGFSQNNFKPGYFINNANQRVECEIDDENWITNPTTFRYRTSNQDEILTAGLKGVKEFGIINESKYISVFVNIDRSSEIIGHLSETKNPEFKKENLFLKVLIEGDVSLYSYKQGNLKRYFIKTNSDEEITQLVYKSYYAINEASMNKTKVKKTNKGYRQQLYMRVKCANQEIQNFNKIDYTERDLSKIVLNYNQCQGADVSYQNKPKKRKFIYGRVKAGANIYAADIDHTTNQIWSDVKFDSKVGFRIGFEFEAVLPLNGEEWALLLEPTYSQFNASNTVILNEGGAFERVDNAELDYNSIELAFGIKKYFKLNEDSNLFLNALVVVDVPSGSGLTFETVRGYGLNSKTNFALGVGYSLHKKYSAELRYYTPREIIADNTAIKSDFRNLSIVFGYTVF